MPAPEPEMNDPEDLPPEESDEPSAPPPSRARPDWLVGAEEGVASEWNRTSGSAPEQPVRLRLVKPEEVGPGEENESESDAARRRLHLTGPDENIGLTRPAGKQLPQAGTVRRRPAAWAAASSSVPTLKRSAPTMPQPKFNQLQDGDPENLMSKPQEGVGTRELEAEDSITRAAAPSVHLAPLKESPWMVAFDALGHNRQLQAGIGVVIVAILAWTFWPRGEASVSVSRIRKHPDQYDGQMVRVHGKIGDVYQIAGGYTFYLLQGRDTMVVFTRVRVPVSDQSVSIRGSISTGYLDGVARQALFEDGKQ